MMGRWIFVRAVRLSRRQACGAVGLIIGALIATLPLRLALAGVPGIAAREASGPAWSGTLRDLRVGPAPFGDVDAGIDPLPLLIGRTQVWLRREGTTDAVRARLGLGGGRVRLVQLDGVVQLPGGFGGLPVQDASFDGFDLRMDGAGCREARGTVSLTLPAFGPGASGAPLTLTGIARCERDAAVVPLQSAGGLERLVLRIGAQGGWTASLTLPADPAHPFRAAGRF
ncbi:MAG: hypothetical protein RIS94_1820 [Pseudomonadota bacterium]|jgi:general secretion pathway protein N